MKKPKVISAVVLGILFAIFLIQNTQVISLRLYFWKISMSQIILIPLVLVLGFLLGYLVAKMTGKSPPPKEPKKL
ncbi:MAG: lipopolysaccharide assembly protein LapA domain-containing protein [Desulfobacteraceae bacterium]